MRTVGLALVGIGVASVAASLITGDWRFLLVSLVAYLVVRKTA